MIDAVKKLTEFLTVLLSILYKAEWYCVLHSSFFYSKISVEGHWAPQSTPLSSLLHFAFYTNPEFISNNELALRIAQSLSLTASIIIIMLMLITEITFKLPIQRPTVYNIVQNIFKKMTNFSVSCTGYAVDIGTGSTEL